MSKILKGMQPVAVMCAGLWVAGCAHGQCCPAGDATEMAEPVAVAVAAPIRDGQYDKPGFFTELDDKDGRLWIFVEGSDDLQKYLSEGRPARHVLRPSAGPDGLTLKSTESATIIEYIASRPGFYVALDKDERLWVFEEGSEALAEYKEKGKPARHVVRPVAGPLGLTIKAVEFEVLDAYMAAQ